MVLQLKNCLGCGMSIGNLCLRVMLSAKHLVSNRGHTAHAWQQHLIGFLKTAFEYVLWVFNGYKRLCGVCRFARVWLCISQLGGFVYGF